MNEIQRKAIRNGVFAERIAAHRFTRCQTLQAALSLRTSIVSMELNVMEFIENQIEANIYDFKLRPKVLMFSTQKSKVFKICLQSFEQC